MVQSWHRIYESGEQRPISGRYYPLQPLPHHGLCLPSFLSSIWGCEIATEPMCKMVFQWCETGIAPPTQPKVLSCGSPVDVVHKDCSAETHYRSVMGGSAGFFV